MADEGGNNNDDDTATFNRGWTGTPPDKGTSTNRVSWEGARRIKQRAKKIFIIILFVHPSNSFEFMKQRGRYGSAKGTTMAEGVQTK
jgi:hypothetical protein